ncbi:MAG: hypothetical protein Q7T26_07955 [Dehalococcoidia bacterium]|nr:hypothetical protein [Dehalococcoidia bacterium]
MIRSLQPADLWSLVQFTRTPRANEARPREKLTRSCAETVPPHAVFADWVPARGRRYVWVTSADRQIRAVASLRPRAGRDAWEIDTLLLGADSGGLCAELLERVGLTAGAQGVQRVFLRLDSESPLVPEAARAGFVTYQRERLVQACAQPSAAAPSVPPEMRPRAACDDYPLFRLYQVSVPSGVQAAEGATFKEWQATREKGWGQGKRSEFVYEGNGQLLGWLRVTHAAKCGYLDILVRPNDEAVARVLADVGGQRLAGKECVLSLVRETDTAVIRSLRTRGFEQREEYVTLVKHMAARVRAPCLIPAGA